VNLPWKPSSAKYRCCNPVQRGAGSSFGTGACGAGAKVWSFGFEAGGAASRFANHDGICFLHGTLGSRDFFLSEAYSENAGFFFAGIVLSRSFKGFTSEGSQTFTGRPAETESNFDVNCSAMGALLLLHGGLAIRCFAASGNGGIECTACVLTTGMLTMLFITTSPLACKELRVNADSAATTSGLVGTLSASFAASWPWSSIGSTTELSASSAAFEAFLDPPRFLRTRS